MRKLILASVSALAVCYGAHADDAPSHVKVVPYSPLVRTNIIGVVGQPTTITFPKGQSIYRVAQTGKVGKDGSLGDAGWQGPDPKDIKDMPLGNNLTLWPAASGDSTMSVITMTNEGVQTVYPFHLTARPDETGAMDAAAVTLNLIFDGAAPRTAPIASPTHQSEQHVVTLDSTSTGRTWPAKKNPAKEERAIALERIRTDAFNGADGVCHYHPHGKRGTGIEPRCPMDNGQWTLMRFPGLSKKPAVYVVSGEKHDDERLARQHGDGDFVVVEEIAPMFRLRLGSSVLDVVNDAYDPAGKPTSTGTISPTVERLIIRAKAQ